MNLRIPQINQRLFFLLIIVATLFVVKAHFAMQMDKVLIQPDETVYGYQWDILNLSPYSIFPYLYGYYGGLIANCAFSSLCAVPLFFIFRKHRSERTAAILTVLVSFFAPLWLYSLTNMTESLLFLTSLTTLLFLDGWSGWKIIPSLIKPTGSAITFAEYKYGFWLALIVGLAGAIVGFNLPANPILNSLEVWWRIIVYVAVGSTFTIFFPLGRLLSNQADREDKFLLMVYLLTFAGLFALSFRLESQYFFGRYFDAAILMTFPIAFKPTKITKTLKVIIIACVLLTAGYFWTHQHIPLMDAALMPFWDSLRLAIEITNR